MKTGHIFTETYKIEMFVCLCGFFFVRMLSCKDWSVVGLKGKDSLSIFNTNILIVGLSDHFKPRGLSETIQGKCVFLILFYLTLIVTSRLDFFDSASTSSPSIVIS